MAAFKVLFLAIIVTVGFIQGMTTANEDDDGATSGISSADADDDPMSERKVSAIVGKVINMCKIILRILRDTIDLESEDWSPENVDYQVIAVLMEDMLTKTQDMIQIDEEIKMYVKYGGENKDEEYINNRRMETLEAIGKVSKPIDDKIKGSDINEVARKCLKDQQKKIKSAEYNLNRGFENCSEQWENKAYELATKTQQATESIKTKTAALKTISKLCREMFSESSNIEEYEQCRNEISELLKILRIMLNGFNSQFTSQYETFKADIAGCFHGVTYEAQQTGNEIEEEMQKCIQNSE